MQFYRCKCGSLTSWTSMGVSSCVTCTKCGSDLAQGPSEHGEPEPHRWVIRFDPVTGVKFDICHRCMARRESPT